MNPVRQEPIKNRRNTSGVCYAIIPEGVERDKYIQDCYRRGIISVQFEDGSNSFDARVGLSVLQLIDFPANTRELGSALVFVTEYHHNTAIIIDRLIKDDESTSLKENEFKLEKFTDNGSVSISGKAEDGNLFIKVSGQGNTGGKIFIDVTNPDKTGEIIVNLQGNFKMELQDMILNILKGLNISTKEDVNINTETNVNINATETINLGDTEENLEPVLLGATTKTEIEKTNTLLQALITIISGAPIPEPGSGAPSALQTALAGAISGQSLGSFTDITSDKTFTQ